MKTFLAATIAAFAIIFTACGDDSSSNVPNENPSPSIKTITKTGRYQIDESQNLLILIPDSTHRYACVVDGDSFAWERVPLYNNDTAKYEFQGDSLILYAFRGGHKSRLEEIFIGGKPGRFEGTWSRSCLIHHYYDDDKQPECENPPTFSFTFSDGKLSQTDIIDPSQDIDENPDFMNSSFMAQLYDAINGGYLFRTANSLFENDSSSVQRAIEENKVNIKKNEQTSQVFEIKGKTFTININKATETPIYNEMFYTTNIEIQVELSDGTTTCKLDYSEKVVDKDLCNAQNSDFLMKSDLKGKFGLPIQNSEGKELEEAYRYNNLGYNSFSECINKLVLN